MKIPGRFCRGFFYREGGALGEVGELGGSGGSGGGCFCEFFSFHFSFLIYFLIFVDNFAK